MATIKIKTDGGKVISSLTMTKKQAKIFMKKNGNTFFNDDKTVLKRLSK